MCERTRRRRATAALLLALALPGVATAQASPEAEYAARATDARRRFVAASKRAADLRGMFDSLVAERRRTLTVDSVRAGEIVVRVVGAPLPAPSRAALERAVTRAWTTIDRLGDPGVTTMVGREPLEVVVVTGGRFAPTRISLGLVGNSRTISLGRVVDASRTEAAIVDLYGSAVASGVDRPFAAWIGAQWIPLAAPTDDDWQEVGVELATSRSSFARGCLSGGIGDCLSALELDGRAGDNLQRWYRTGDITALVVEWSPRDSAQRALRARCVDDRVDSLCLLAVRTMNLPRPMSHDAIRTLMAFAVERGGPGAVTRMLATGGTPASRLSAAAGVPARDLVEAWHAQVAAAPVPRSLPSAGQGAAIVGWTLIFGMIAARRRP